MKGRRRVRVKHAERVKREICKQREREKEGYIKRGKDKERKRGEKYIKV